MNTSVYRRISLILLLVISAMALRAQSGIVASGGNASGTGGTVSYSIGQVFYTMNFGTTGSVLQGVQQPWEISGIEGALQTISLALGWNLFSYNILPFNADFIFNFQPLIDAGHLVKIQDENGDAIEYFGFLGTWVNDIGDISLTEGYKAKVKANCQVTSVGTKAVLPFDIPLKTGWNIIGYPRDTEVDGLAVVQQLIDRGKLIKVQDENGDAIEYFGFLGTWVNNIGNFIPGCGYKVKVSANETLTVYASYAKAAHTVVQKAPLTHFRTVVEGSGVDHMNIYLTGFQTGIFQAGDEIGVFDGNLCVGALSLLPAHLNIGAIPLVASAADNLDGVGFTEGKPFSLRLWKKQGDNEYQIDGQVTNGSSSFVKHESVWVSLGQFGITGLRDYLLPETVRVICYPNPTQGKIQLQAEGFLPHNTLVEVTDALGRRLITTRMDNDRIILDLSGNAGGIYYIRVTHDQWYQTERIVLKQQ